MDFLDPKKKRAHLIRLYIGYALIAVGLIAGTIILAFSAYGYDIDRKTGDVIQNGLMILDAKPATASILINGKDQGSTNNRLVLPAAKYSVELRSNGYTSWRHDVNLEGSSIEQLGYPFLFPSKPDIKTAHVFSASLQMATESLDRRWLVTNSPSDADAFSLIDLATNTNPTTSINLPSGIMTATNGPQSTEAIEWSADNTHLLLKHNFSGGSEFIMLNRENPLESQNLTRLFPDQLFTEVHLRNKKSDQFYLLNGSGGNLYQADSKTKTALLVLEGVLSYKSYDADTLLYVKSIVPNSSTVETRVRRNNEDYLLRTLPAAPTYLLEMAQFNGQFYIASGSSADGRTYFYKDPFNEFKHRPATTPQPFRVFIVPGSQYVSFSSNAKFLSVQGGSAFSVYDIETGRQFRYDTKLPLDASQKAVWMDGYRITLISAGKVTVFDFDGMNTQTLTAGLPLFGPFFDRDYAAMFTLAAAQNTIDNKTVLIRTELKVAPVK